MSYTPYNAPVYLKAYAGALAGFAAVSCRGDGGYFACMADAFAQAVDDSWGDTAYTTLVLDIVQAHATTYWTGRSPSPAPGAFDPRSYEQIADAVTALARAGGAQVTAEGVDPNATGPVGGVPFDWTTGAVPVAAPRVFGALIVVSTPFDTAATVTFGPSSAPAAIFALGDVDLTRLNTYQNAAIFDGGPFVLAVQSNGSTVGKAVLVYSLY